MLSFRSAPAVLAAAALIPFTLASFTLASFTLARSATSATGELAVGAMANFIVLEDPAPVPDHRFADAEGRPASLEDFRGKLVLLNFWATWCAPCRREMPDLDRLQAELGGARFQVVALSSDRQGPSVVQEFYDELGITRLPLYIDKTAKTQRAFRAFGLPTTVLIGPGGEELGRLVGPADWASPEAVALIRHFLSSTKG